MHKSSNSGMGNDNLNENETDNCKNKIYKEFNKHPKTTFNYGKQQKVPL